jgi:hypothetical protein
MPEQPFTPLSRLNLARSIETEMLGRPCVALPPPRFEGAGVYAIYYGGSFPDYAPISQSDCVAPIYVGKAVPRGGRTGGLLEGAVTGTPLWGRLREHGDSIAQAVNLEQSDFRCRYLVVEDIWIPLGENLLISHFRPLWNSRVLEGFGNHDPGAGRRNSRRSPWDALHPGRSWADRLQPASLSEAEIRQRVAEFLAEPEDAVVESADSGEDGLAGLA